MFFSHSFLSSIASDGDREKQMLSSELLVSDLNVLLSIRGRSAEMLVDFSSRTLPLVKIDGKHVSKPSASGICGEVLFELRRKKM